MLFEDPKESLMKGSINWDIPKVVPQQNETPTFLGQSVYMLCAT